MKKLFLSILFVFVVTSASAVFSGHYLCYRFGGATYQNRLYTSTGDVGPHYMGVRLGGVPLYMMLGTNTRADAEHFRAQVAGTAYAGIPIAHAYDFQFGDDTYRTLNIPVYCARDGSGNIYVTDYAENEVIKYNASGTLVAAWGAGLYDTYLLSEPRGIAVDSSGYVYVVDRGNSRVIKYNSSGTYVTKWGSSGTGNGQFSQPEGIAIGSDGYVYVADNLNYRIQKFNTSGTYSAQWGSYGTSNGQFKDPTGIAGDASGYLYVTDYINGNVQKFNTSGTYQTKWSASVPIGIYSGSSGYVYVSGNNAVSKYTTTGTSVFSFGSSGTGNGQFYSPMGICGDANSTIYVVDSGNGRVQAFR